mmetsp:Transcript_31185/g.65257  ORF Transcript_31185/g.65257 Transcript_31185/m.65257 type:complete len:128 (-) Transcript_31185:25-408(-)
MLPSFVQISRSLITLIRDIVLHNSHNVVDNKIKMHPPMSSFNPHSKFSWQQQQHPPVFQMPPRAALIITPYNAGASISLLPRDSAAETLLNYGYDGYHGRESLVAEALHSYDVPRYSRNIEKNGNGR